MVRFDKFPISAGMLVRELCVAFKMVRPDKLPISAGNVVSKFDVKPRVSNLVRFQIWVGRAVIWFCDTSKYVKFVRLPI